MKVDDHHGPVVVCNFRNLRCRDEETFGVERARLLSPRQPDKPRRGRSAEGRLADMDMSFVVWKQCGGTSVVSLDTVTGGHNTWFGSTLDPVPGEPNASAAVWDFFNRCTEPTFF